MFYYLNASQPLETVVLIKPTTVPEEHHKGPRIYRRWGAQSRVRRALPAQCGVEVRQSMVGGQVPRRPKAPALLGGLLANHMVEIAAIDIFVVPPLAV